ncbi:hypothetical protein GPALN_014581 [Globodera pallida]|nr:hypothetical protein GPALN_014581 [Globodera pallida]
MGRHKYHLDDDDKIAYGPTYLYHWLAPSSAITAAAAAAALCVEFLNYTTHVCFARGAAAAACYSAGESAQGGEKEGKAYGELDDRDDGVQQTERERETARGHKRSVRDKGKAAIDADR